MAKQHKLPFFVQACINLCLAHSSVFGFLHFTVKFVGSGVSPIKLYSLVNCGSCISDKFVLLLVRYSYSFQLLRHKFDCRSEIYFIFESYYSQFYCIVPGVRDRDRNCVRHGKTQTKNRKSFISCSNQKLSKELPRARSFRAKPQWV